MTNLTSNTSVTTPEEIEASLVLADKAARTFGALSPQERAAVLESIADELDLSGEELIPIAQKETHLAQGRLTGELKRTTFQLRLFAELLREGRYLDARIDHAQADWPMGAPRPDLRRMLQPLGPVLVYAASNFPFAFSVAGGDTASALAAGCPVLVKAHSGHLELSRLTAAVVKRGLEKVNAPEGVFTLIEGTEAGVTVLKDNRIAAGAFTGSIPGGRALFDIAVGRPSPIPFYGELGSNNPVFVTERASAERAATIAEEFIASYTLGAGQFCTKPGTLVVPQSSTIVGILGESKLPEAAELLNPRIQSGYVSELQNLESHAGVSVLNQGTDSKADPPTPTLLLTTAQDVLNDPEALEAECFGPTALVVTYSSEEEMLMLAESFAGQLTATVQGTDACEVTALIEILARKAGRVLWNQWPTGVSVTYAQQHGGPYPASTVVSSTSVGTAAIERFLRPVAYQNLPQRLLPEPLQDANPWQVLQHVD